MTDFVIELFACEKENTGSGLETALDALDIVALAFSCLFMVELLVSLWAFGLRYGDDPVLQNLSA